MKDKRDNGQNEEVERGNTVMNNMSLSGKIIKGGIWLQVSKFLQLGVNFIVTAVLARLLYPEDFGLIGIIFVYTTFITIFTKVGFGSALIQKQDADQRQISTLYWLNLLFGLFSAAAVFATAPLAAWFYGYDELLPLIRIISANFLVSPLYQIHRKILEKNLRFPILAKIDVLSSLGAGLIGIGCAYSGYGVYSLVFQSICLNVLCLIGIRFALKWKPGYSFSLSHVKEMFYFSIKMKGAQLSRYFEKNIDLFILGKMFTSEIFGFYTLAVRIVNIPIRRICHTFAEVLFPSFSSIQDDLKRIKKGYLKSVQMMAIFIFPLILLVGLYARPLVIHILGERWLPAADILLLLSWVGAIQSVELLSTVVYPAINRPDISLKLGIIRALVTGPAVFIGGSYGLLGAALAIFISKGLLFIVSLQWLRKFLEFSYVEMLKYMSGPLLGMSLIIIISHLIKGSVTDSLIKIVIALAVNLAFYTTAILLINFKDLKFIFVKLRDKA